jgi:hypothetical protein
MFFDPEWLGILPGNPRCSDEGERKNGNCDDHNPPTLAPVHS